MKIRTGFVSNSSSSSFCIYGTVIDREFLNIYTNLLENDDESERISDDLYDMFRGEYECHVYPYEDHEYFIGKSLTTIKDEETFKEFKENIEKHIREKLIEYFKKDISDKIKFGIMEESWYDG